MLRTILVALLALPACSQPTDARRPVSEDRADEPPATAPAPPAPSPAPPASPPSPPSTLAPREVVARVVDSGPIGSGRCTQCSHQVVIEQSGSADLPAGGAPTWMHFERCSDQPAAEPTPGAIDPCALRRGTTYRLTVQRGASPNFGDAPMILEARPL